MKRYLFSFIAILCVAASSFAAKIYVNPGHGSWNTANCRNMKTINYQTYGDTLGFWESNTNMWKCYALQEKLVAAGHTVKMSRTKSGGTSQQSNSQYDKKLSVIAMESENWGSDYFISVHSNAAGTDDYGNAYVNYPSYFYRGTMSRPNHYPKVKNSDKMALAAWPLTFLIHDNGMEFYSYWSMTNPGIYGDITQMGSSSTVNGYTGYFGVLKHGDPGYLVEGYFHVYSPARHRAMNPDWCRQEGIRHYRGIQAWYGNTKKETKGYIMGYIRTKEKTLTHNLYKGKGNDVYHPINGAKVVLRNSKGEVIKTDCYRHVARKLKNQDYYTTDHQYNGVFVYENLEPGEYSMSVHASGYKDYTAKITVTADKTSYTEIFLTAGQGTEPNVAPANPDIKWELNGGFVPGGTVPSNDILWESFKTYFNTYYPDGSAEAEAIKAAGTPKFPRGGQDMTSASTFWPGGVDSKANIFTNSNSDWKWLGDYIKSVASAQGYSVDTESAWRWHMHALFNCAEGTFNVGEVTVNTANFTSAGKPSAWGNAYLAGTGSAATLPSSVTNTYTLPTPVKEGYVFKGWYNNASGTGSALTTISAGYKGTLYALWEEESSADVKWVLNGGAVTGVLPKEITTTYQIPTPTRTGYVFLGWYDNANGTGTALKTLSVGYKGTVYALWREAKVTWVLNGGKVMVESSSSDAVKVPTQDELWASFKGDNGLTTLGTLAEIKSAAGSNPHNDANTPCACRAIAAKVTNDKMATLYTNTNWTWLIEYIKGVQPNIEEDLTVEGALAAWRYAIAAFFLQDQHDAWPVTEDYSTAGKPEMWGNTYQKAHSGASSTVEAQLPTKITATYTLPTPVKDGYAFLGWYDNADAMGNALTSLPVGFDGTVYAIWSDTEVTNSKVIWVLNGGKVVKEVTTTTPGTAVKVPTQEELWDSFNAAAGFGLGELSSITVVNTIAGKATAANLDAVFAKAEWKWLKEYIMTAQNAQVGNLVPNSFDGTGKQRTVPELTNEMAPEVDNTATRWRYSVAAFFLQTQCQAYPPTADFAAAGKPEAWGPAYQKAHGDTQIETKTELVEVELPTQITVASYIIPTPIKENDTFIGWYDNNNGTGTALTELPFGYNGTVYAIWESMGTTTELENIRPTLDTNAPMYDLLGRQVNATYRGIIIQNGNKYLLR